LQDDEDTKAQPSEYDTERNIRGLLTNAGVFGGGFTGCPEEK